MVFDFEFSTGQQGNPLACAISYAKSMTYCPVRETVLLPATNAKCRANRISGEAASMSDHRKPRNIVRFRERELSRVTKALRVAGGGTVTLDPVTGNYTIVVAGEDEVQANTATDNP